MTNRANILCEGCWIVVLCLACVLSADIRDVRGPPRKSGEYEARQIVKVGQTKKRLICPVDPDETTIVQWYKGEDLIDNNFWTRYKISKDSSLSLRIKDVEMEDAGLFICKVSNGFGSIQFNFTLIVIDGDDGYILSPNEDPTKEGSKPYFVDAEKMRKRDHQRPVGSSLRLRCRADGNPSPIVHWYKAGSDLPLYGDDEHSLRKHSTLKLRDLKENDSGDYKCVATNKHGEIHLTYTVEVIAKISKEATLIGPDPQNETVPIGGQATFHCKVKSKDKPHIRWLKRLDADMEYLVNKTNIFEVKGQKFLVLKTDDVHPKDGFYVNKLIIKNVKRTDVGMYICLGTNAIGYSYRIAFLTIQTDGDGMDGSGPGGSPLDGPNPNSTGSVGNGSLPLIIAVPACVAIVVVAIAIFILKRRRQCNNNNTANTHRNTRFNAVPTQERETFPPPVVHNNTHQAVPPTVKGPPNPNRSADKVSKNHSIDFYSDISSVSRCHHHQGHSNHQYGY